MGMSDGDRDPKEAEERWSHGDTTGLEGHGGTDGLCNQVRGREPEDRVEVGVAKDKGRVGG